jgi:hypothetical protein
VACYAILCSELSDILAECQLFARLLLFNFGNESRDGGCSTTKPAVRPTLFASVTVDLVARLYCLVLVTLCRNHGMLGMRLYVCLDHLLRCHFLRNLRMYCPHVAHSKMICVHLLDYF